MELHCSQTAFYTYLSRLLFEYPMELHCSQTSDTFGGATCSLSTLWNYTALKRLRSCHYNHLRLSTLWNYTALKRSVSFIPVVKGLSTLWNYTALKPLIDDNGNMTV